MRRLWLSNACVWKLLQKACDGYKWFPPRNKCEHMKMYSLQSEGREFKFRVYKSHKMLRLTVSGERLEGGKMGKEAEDYWPKIECWVKNT